MNLRDVAAKAGVSPMTVSNVLNGRASVQPANRERVLAAIKELGYTPNVSARQLRRGRAAIMGIVVPEAFNPFYGDIARGVSDRAEEGQITALTMTSHDSLDREHSLLDLLTGMRVAGIVLSSVSNWQALRPRVEALTAAGIPLVALAAADDVGDACSTVAGDDLLGGQLVGRHLAQLGHRRIAFIGGPVGLSVFEARYSGLLKGLAAEGQDASQVSYAEFSHPSMEAGYEEGLDLLNSSDRPSAVFCANDLLALGILRAAATSGLRVPDDLAIIGYDDIPFASGAAVPLTSVAQPTRAMGRKAADVLLDRSNGVGSWPTQDVFEPVLNVRQSTQLA